MTKTSFFVIEPSAFDLVAIERQARQMRGEAIREGVTLLRAYLRRRLARPVGKLRAA